jgi:uncharacterized repeat protein (TIGR01451 family)
MRKLKKYRRFIFNMVGILPLVISLGSSKVAFAATSASDISVTMVADRSKVKVGQTITYTATATNLGPDDAYSVDVGFSLPDQFSLVSMTCDQGISPDTPFCEYSNLKAGETVVSILVATPNSDVRTRERHLMVTAGISFETVDTVDPDLSNNVASVSTKLIGKLAHP